jgi:putative transferase (TIGR04331 family)
MKNRPYFLITTADEKTWKFDRHVIFLGDWCRIYNRRHVWKNMDAVVADPYGLSEASKDADNLEARELEKLLLSRISLLLNKFHGVQYTQKFWQIFLGHWLRRYADLMLNRVKTLEACLKKNRISGTAAYAMNNYNLATVDSYSAIWAFNDDRWNNALNQRILDFLDCGFPVEIIADCGLKSFHMNASLESSPGLVKKICRWGYKKLHVLAKEHDAFILNSYLPKILEIGLNFALRQSPQMWFSSDYKVLEQFNSELRVNLSKEMVIKSKSKLTEIMSSMMFEMLPICYLEGFYNLNKAVNELPWPKSPKFIFTSNSFDFDEMFKLWAAKKVEIGIKYIVGQHGANYGTHRHWLSHTIEEQTSYMFLTWGWSDELRQHTPAFIFNKPSIKLGNYKKKGGLLLIELPLNHRFTTWDDTAEFAKYFQDQQIFVKELRTIPKRHLTVRLHAASRFHNWDEDARWSAIDSSLKIDAGNVDISNLVSASRLVVHSYDSTGMLETLSQNIPTIAFWPNGFAHLRESAKPFYQLLVDAGIVYTNPKLAAQKVNEVWDDVDLWWRQKHVQIARIEFCNRYAKTSQTPIRDLMNLLNG